MSSFINKSGKKVAPKGAPRRRPAGGPAAISQPQSQFVVGSAQGTPQPSEVATSDPNTQLPTPNATQIEKSVPTPVPIFTASPKPSRPPDVDSSSAPTIQSSTAPQTGPEVSSSEIHAIKASIASVTPAIQRDVTVPPLITVSTVTRQRSASPVEAADGSRAAKRRRVEDVVDVIQFASTRTEVVRNASRSPEATRRSPETTRRTVPSPAPPEPQVPQSRVDEDIPQVVISAPRAHPSKPDAIDSPDGPPVIHTSSRPRQLDSPSAERLVHYETPHQTGASQNSQSNARPLTSLRPAASTAITNSTTPKPRAKGSRKDQWQVSTPNDVATGKGKRKSRKPVDRIQVEPRLEVGDDDDLPSITDLAPKSRKVRKDKGLKKVSKAQQAQASDEPQTDNPIEIADDRGSDEDETGANTPAAEDGSQADHQPLTDAASKRLANLRKRKAKQLAKNAALSKAIGRANATIIDDAVAQSIEGRGRGRSSASRAKNTPVPSQTPHRDSTVATEMTEGGTVVRKGRTKRAETPEENESVFIVEGQTSMWDLTKRDTENRVGFKSEREKLMRQIDWAEVKVKRKAEEERMARMARGKRLLDEDYDPEEEGMDEDEKLARAVARNKNKRPGLQITLMANGEHVVDEQSQMIDRQRLHEDELELLEEVEEDDLTKKFNVQTYVTWRRKEEDERVMVNEKWTWEQTEKFYDALASFGTDFMIISKLFRGKTRRHIKSKFVREERAEPERIRDALTAHAGGRRNGQGGYDLETFMKGSGLGSDAFLDPKKIEEELKRERVEREKEIEEQRAETKEEERQRKLAGALNGEDELGSDGEPLSPGGVVRAAQAEARRKKLERMGEKKRKILEMAGGAEEIVETIEDDE
jgi:transcription factor TFIIIB component B''